MRADGVGHDARRAREGQAPRRRETAAAAATAAAPLVDEEAVTRLVEMGFDQAQVSSIWYHGFCS